MPRVKVLDGVDEPVTAPVLASAIARGRQRQTCQPVLPTMNPPHARVQETLRPALAGGSSLVLPAPDAPGGS